MSREQIPITPAVLTWARVRAGYTLDEARGYFRDIEAWELSESFPSYPQLEKLAGRFKTPIAVFFFPEPPDLEPLSKSFRTMPEPQFEQISRRVRFLLRKAKAFQISLAELSDGKNPADRLITRDLSFPANVPVTDMASRVRNYLGITLEQQMGWESEDKALENWRYRLNDVGVFVFKDAFQEENYSGFCLYDDEFPIIYANNSTAKTRQIFTLFHELAHLLYHTSGVDKFRDNYIDALDGDAKRDRNLVQCSASRRGLLVPADAFSHEFSAGLKPAGKPQRFWPAGSASAVKSFTGSFRGGPRPYRRVLIRRSEFWPRSPCSYESGARSGESLRADFAGDKKTGKGGNYYNNQIAYLGPRYIGLALRQYYADRIDEAQLADHLNIAPRNIVPLEEKFLGRGE